MPHTLSLMMGEKVLMHQKLLLRTRNRLVRVLPLLFLLALFASPARSAESSSRNKLLLASDIHFNPMADAGLVPELEKAQPARWEAILERSEPRSFSPYGQDTNWWLLQSALDQMHKTMPRPAVFLVTGDLLAHGFRVKFQAATQDNNLQHYRVFVLKTVQFLALQLRNRWPDTQILLTPGNNDDDCDDYAIEANGAFLHDTAATVRELANGDDQLEADWKALGSYSLLPPAFPGIRIVSLNTVFFSAKYEPESFQNSCAQVQSTAPYEAFAWLERSLAIAQEASQKVWLMFHIPPGIDGFASTHPQGGPVPPTGPDCAKDIVAMWAPEWTVKFDSLLVNYRSTVTAAFAGHTHTDDFRVITDGNSPSGFVLVDPPISPVYNQNPAFRVFDIAGDSVTNQTTYYLTNLTTAGAKHGGRWKKEYEFSREWKTKRLDAASLGKIYNEIATTETARRRWLKLYNVSSTAAKVPPAAVPGLYCAIEGLGVGAYRVCACTIAQ